MNCKRCKAPIDDDDIICWKCKNIKGTPSCFSLLVIFFILLLLSFALYPPIGGAMLKANMTAVACKGKDIYVAITGANKDREAEFLPLIWPKTYRTSTNLTNDISEKIFKTSTEYFAALYDDEHLGTEAWKPWIHDFDYSKLAGAGVSSPTDKGKLQAKNNMWLIAANVTSEDADIIPIMITRNVDVKEIERAINYGFTTTTVRLKTPVNRALGAYRGFRSRTDSPKTLEKWRFFRKA